MNTRTLLTAALAALAISGFTQGRPPAGGAGATGGQQRGMRMGMLPDDLKKQIKLTAAQETKLKAIQDKYMKLFDNMRKEMDAVYTPQQKAAIEKWRSERRARFGGGPGGGPAAGGPPRGGAKSGGGAKGGGG